MDKKIIGLGVGAGVAASLVSFAYNRIHLSPAIDAAIEYEAGRSDAQAALSGDGHTHEHEIFTRFVQENIGAGVGMIVFGAVMGAIFAVAMVVALKVLRRNDSRMDPRPVALGLAAAAFVAVALFPALAYPPNPPGVGDADTIAARTTAHLTVTVASVALAVVAGVIGARARARFGVWPAAVGATAGYLGAMTVVVAVAPSYREIPGPVRDSAGAITFPGFPADVLSDFRVGSLISQAILWTVIAACVIVALPRLTEDSRVSTGDLRAHHH